MKYLFLEFKLLKATIYNTLISIRFYNKSYKTKNFNALFQFLQLIILLRRLVFQQANNKMLLVLQYVLDGVNVFQISLINSCQYFSKILFLSKKQLNLKVAHKNKQNERQRIHKILHIYFHICIRLCMWLLHVLTRYR